MAIYDCKTEGCEGKISFPSQKSHSKSDKDMVIKLVIIEEEPVQCSKCGKSWYESDLES